MPLIIPLPRYFSMPSREFGACARRVSARNCRPCCGSRIQSPVAAHPFAAVDRGQRPSTVTRSRWPRTLTRSTAKPFCSLKKVTRSTWPSMRFHGAALDMTMRCGGPSPARVNSWPLEASAAPRYRGRWTAHEHRFVRRATDRLATADSPSSWRPTGQDGAAAQPGGFRSVAPGKRCRAHVSFRLDGA